MRVLILRQAVADDAPPDERDVLVQAHSVAQALRTLGLDHEIHACDLNLQATRQSLTTDPPTIVFNLVESLGGSDRLMMLAPALLDTLGIPYTGAPADALFVTTHKLLAKRLMTQAGLPTPPWIEAQGDTPHPSRTARAPAEFLANVPYIVKTVFEHASFGLDDQCVVTPATEAELQAHMEQRRRQFQRPVFAEQFIEGREFNVSLLADANGPQVLPLAQIDFSAFPSGKPRIVGYQAKWNDNSFECQATPRTFDGPCDAPLAERLSTLAAECFALFGLRGWARVDFRVNAQGQPWILEVNANPCLSPDAGFAAALKRGGIPFEKAVARILRDAGAAV